MAMNKKLYALCAVALSLIGALASAVTIWLHFLYLLDPSRAPSFCKVSATVQCAAVITSQYSELFGQPLGVFGLVYFLFLLAVAAVVMVSLLRGSPQAVGLLVLGSWAGVLSSCGLFLLSKFVIKAVCPACLIIYLTTIALGVISWLLVEGRVWVAIAQGVLTSLAFPLMLSGGRGRGALAAGWLIAFGGVVIMLAALLVRDSIAARIEHIMGKELEQEIAQVILRWRNSSPAELQIRTKGVERDFAIGSDSALVTLVMFSDYECPHCRDFYLELRVLLAEFKDQIRIIHKHFPLDQRCNPLILESLHQNACLAAEFARCAGEQGRFVEADDYLFSLPSIEEQESAEVVAADIRKGAQALSLDSRAMEGCFASGRQRAAIDADIKLADRLKVEGTPTVFINSKRFEIPNVYVIERLLKQEFNLAPVHGPE